jgi:hypothetical protein
MSSKKKPRTDRPITAAQQRKAHDQLVASGAFQPPTNVLVKRDPAETVAKCRSLLLWVAFMNRAYLTPDIAAGMDSSYHTLIDALQHVEKQLEGFWAATSKVAS